MDCDVCGRPPGPVLRQLGPQPNCQGLMDPQHWRLGYERMQDQRDAESWMHAACLTIAEGVVGWDDPIGEDPEGLLQDSLAMQKVRGLRKRMEKAEALNKTLTAVLSDSVKCCRHEIELLAATARAEKAEEALAWQDRDSGRICPLCEGQITNIEWERDCESYPDSGPNSKLAHDLCVMEHRLKMGFREGKYSCTFTLDAIEAELRAYEDYEGGNYPEDDHEAASRALGEIRRLLPAKPVSK